MMDKEEIFKVGPENKVEKNCEDLWVRVKFDVSCDSSPYIQNGKSIAACVAKYVNDCFEAMDESMRHWGDHEHCIDPIKVTLFREDDEGNDLQQDVTDEILGE